MGSTRVFEINPDEIDQKAIDEAAALLLGGELVAFPTETVYGLGGLGLNPASASKIYEAKGRPSDNPLILHIHDFQQIHVLANGVPVEALHAAERFWPGPLTIVLAKKAFVPDATTGGLDTVAIRMPNHPVSLALLEAVGEPLAAPSANLSGKPSPTRAEHVMEDLEGVIAGVIDGGPTVIGVESTVVDFAHGKPTILRKGSISKEALNEVIPGIEDATSNHVHHSPGTRYRHYSPNARITILPADEKETLALLQKEMNAGTRIGWIGPVCPDPDRMTWSFLANDADAYAKEFFSLLREMDRQQVQHIVVEPVDEVGVGAAVMDRMRKAAGI